MFTPVSETTQRVVAERRLRTLRELAERSSRAQSVERAYTGMAEVLGENPYDIPFSAIYQIRADRKEGQLVATAGIAAGSSVSPQTLSSP